MVTVQLEVVMKNQVVYCRISQVEKIAKLAIIAQGFMPEGKNFGLCVWGESGIGKTSVTDNLADHFSAKQGVKWALVDCNLSACVPEDVSGYPRVMEEKLGYLTQWQMADDSSGVFRIDEFDRPAYFQNLIATAKFAIDRQGDTKLPEKWFVLALGNGISDSHTEELTEHLKGRFVHVYVSTNSQKAQDERLDYLKTLGVDDFILQYEVMNPYKTRDEFEPHAVENYRTRVYAYAIIKAYQALMQAGHDVSDVILPLLAGAIGKNGAIELLKLMDLKNLPTLDEVIANPKTTEIPDDLSLRHKYITVLVNQATNDCEKATKLLDYLVRLPNEVARYAIDTLMLGCPDIVKTQTYVQWSNRLK